MDVDEVDALLKESSPSKPKKAKIKKTTENTTETDVSEETKISNRKRKELRRIKIADLKQTVRRPDLVDEHDCNSGDPHLLIWLKSCRNTVSVPPHW